MFKSCLKSAGLTIREVTGSSLTLCAVEYGPGQVTRASVTKQYLVPAKGFDSLHS